MLAIFIIGYRGNRSLDAPLLYVESYWVTLKLHMGIHAMQISVVITCTD